MKTEHKTSVITMTNAESNQALRGIEILLADASVEQLAVLLDGLRPGVEVHLIHPQDDALALFTQCCSREHLDTLHVLGHGAPGEVILGSQKLDQAALVSIQERLVSMKAVAIQGLDTNASTELQKTNSRSASSYEGATQTPFLETQICLWSCQTGAGHKGQQFMNTLANITNATIFATENLVGNQTKGGTWDLEKIVSPRRGAPFNAQAIASFDSVLPLGGSNTSPVITGDLNAIISENNASLSYTLTKADLYYSDADGTINSKETFNIFDLVNGVITVNNSIATSFTAAQLAANNVRFIHNGSDLPTASFKVSLTDQVGAVTGTTSGVANLPVTGNPITTSLATFNFTVTPVNDVPVLLLNGVNSSYSASYDEAATSGTSVVGSNFHIIDPDNATMASLSVVLTNAVAGDRLDWNQQAANNAGFDVFLEDSFPGVLTLSIIGDGSQTKSQFEEFAKSIAFK